MKMAGMAQVLSHRDPSHARDSLLRLNKLRREGILCDLTILVQGQKFKAHKTVMAACSDYFLATICGAKNSPSVSVTNGPNGEHITIELKYVTVRGFTPLLEYAYSSDLHVNSSDVIDVLSAASYMQMFNVANACSEFMRSNLLWTQTQSRLSLPLMQAPRPMIMNGQNHSEAGSVATTRPNGLPEAVNTLLQASRPTAMGQSPMLMPISSITPYDVGLQNWVDTVAGTQTLLSRFVNGQAGSTTLSPASSISPSSSPHNSPPNGWSGDVVSSSVKQVGSIGISNVELRDPPSSRSSPATRDLQEPISEKRSDENEASDDKYKDISNNNTNNNNNSSSSHSNSRKSVAIKVETASDNESSEILNGGSTQHGSPSPPNDSEDSWQSLQRLYSFQNKPSENATEPPRSESDANANHSPLVAPSLHSHLALKPGSLQAVFEKITGGAMSRLDSPMSMVPRLNGLSVQQALLQHQQQLLASQQQQQQQQQIAKQSEESEKLVADLPAVPPGGQYMSVRRRTLQSNVPKPHQCQICGSRFTRFHNLKQHIKLHSGIKPYECDECGKRFTRNYTLRLHKMKHVGIRNFKCGTCEASFTSLGEFRAHLRITMHSHMPGGSGSSPHSSARMSEPEDLSGPHVPPNLLKFSQFDQGLLKYGVHSPGSSGGGAAGEGSTGSLSPHALHSISNLSNTPRFGSESPQLSEHSLTGSPQDLTTKRSLMDAEEKSCTSDHNPEEVPLTPKSDENDEGHEAKRLKMEDEDEQSALDDEDAHDPDEPMALVVDTSVSCEST